MTDWKTVNCNKCKNKKSCRRHNVSKGSEFCQTHLGLISKREREKTVSPEAVNTSMLWSLVQKGKQE